MTFHSLAYSIVRPSEVILYDNPKLEEYNLSKTLQEIIDTYLIDPEWSKIIRNIMLSHFKTDWELIAERGFNLSQVR